MDREDTELFVDGFFVYAAIAGRRNGSMVATTARSRPAAENWSAAWSLDAERDEANVCALAKSMLSDRDAALLLDANLAVQKYSHGGRALLRARPDALVEVVCALECYVNDATQAMDERLIRLEELARVDRASASSLVDHSENPRIAAAARFFEPGALARYAADLGLPTFQIPDYAVSLHRHLRGLTIGKSSVLPIAYERHLDGLAELAQPSFDSGVFECFAPAEDGDGERRLSGKYQLHFHRAGLSWEVITSADGSWPDALAMVGLMNAVAREADSDSRFVFLELDEGDESVMWATTASIERAVADHVLGVRTDFGHEDEA